MCFSSDLAVDDLIEVVLEAEHKAVNRVDGNIHIDNLQYTRGSCPTGACLSNPCGTRPCIEIGLQQYSCLAACELSVYSSKSFDTYKT